MLTYNAAGGFGRVVMKSMLILSALLGLSGPAMAQSAFAPPQGCTGTLTVQLRSCLVTHLWTCEADAPGEQWIALFGQDGPFQVRKIDAEFQWLTTYYADPPRTETMVQPAPDPESLTELFANADDTYDFTVETDDGAPPERILGFDKLTGETVVIDGEPLLRTEFGYDTLAPDGAIIASRAGRQYVSERHRIFLFGTDWDAETPDEVFDASPVQFIYPGEAGFFAASPRYDCGATMSSFAVQP